jgi:NTE family protein
MATSRPAQPAQAPPRSARQTVLVLQGGGALGAYQAGAYEGVEQGCCGLDWVCGVSIGAINAALIAGNPPERRVERLRAFWQRVSAIAPLPAHAALSALRPVMNRAAATSATLFGIPGFFKPQLPHAAALGWYDTAPLRETLLELVDFDLINQGPVRLSVGAVNIASGNSVYFDSRHTTLTPEHIMASGALPPSFPPVQIDGTWYWDGGIVSNSPLWYVMDSAPELNALVLQVDLFSASGQVPVNLDQVQERAKDIQYASKTRFNSSQLREREDLKAAFRRLLDKLPPDLRDEPDVQALARAARRSTISLVHLINRHNTGSCSVKDLEFSRATVTDLWAAGLSDVRCATHHVDWAQVNAVQDGVHVFDLGKPAPTPSSPHPSNGASP